MQTLGLSDATPRTESRWRALFWPTIRNAVDYDYVTRQGLWICLLVGVVDLLFGLLAGNAFVATIEGLFFVFAGVGVRERSRVAAVAAFAAYFTGSLVLQRYTGNGFSIVRLIFLALLLANVRGSWVSARWDQECEQPALPPLGETIGDWFTYKMPRVLWPKVKSLFYVFVGIEMAMLFALLFARQR